MRILGQALIAVSVLPVAAVGQRTDQPKAVISPSRFNAKAARESSATYVDFANLAMYHDANASLPPPAHGVDRVVFLGDSITEAWGKHFDTAFAGKPYVGRGIGGQTTPQMLWRFEQDAVRLAPAVVVVLAGTNDIAENTGSETDEQIEDNFRAMTAIAEANHIRVVLSSILPAIYLPWRPAIQPAPRIARLNRWLQKFAARSGAIYVDYYTALTTRDGALRPEFAADKYVHPNAAGFAVMQPLAEAAVNAALHQPAP